LASALFWIWRTRVLGDADDLADFFQRQGMIVFLPPS